MWVSVTEYILWEILQENADVWVHNHIFLPYWYHVTSFAQKWNNLGGKDSRKLIGL